jgi:hypothetical protein
MVQTHLLQANKKQYLNKHIAYATSQQKAVSALAHSLRHKPTKSSVCMSTFPTQQANKKQCLHQHIVYDTSQ